MTLIPSRACFASWRMSEKKVLMVCLGNICRSPLAEALLRHKFTQVPANQKRIPSLLVDSCGTASYHIGNLPDNRTIAVLKKHGIETTHRARKLKQVFLWPIEVFVFCEQLPTLQEFWWWCVWFHFLHGLLKLEWRQISDTKTESSQDFLIGKLWSSKGRRDWRSLLWRQRWLWCVFRTLQSLFRRISWTNLT